ncbi:MAG: 50S ribosomal protein L4 [Burkholderiales bacterium]
MELKSIDAGGKAAANVVAADAVFGRDYNAALVHQVVVAQLANLRSGTRAQKGRSDVNKSRRKPWRQKGTGRARAGRASSPLWRGGGVTFPNLPDENFHHKVNRGMYRAGMCCILSELARSERLMVVEEFSTATAKTKDLALKLKGLGMDEVLIVTETTDENLLLAARNLPRVNVVESAAVDPLHLVGSMRVLLTRAALEKIEERLK